MTQSDKKVIKENLEAEAAELFSVQSQLAILEEKLSKNKQFNNYLQLKNKLKSEDDLFRETVKNEMIAHGIPKLKGDWGSITLVTKELVKVTDIEKVPSEYKNERTIIDVDTKSVKDDYTLTNIIPAGIDINKSQYVMVKVAK